MAREMKKSGVDWIGDIPAEWKIGRTKNCYTNRKQIAGDEADNYERLALTLNGVIKRSKEDATGLQPEAFNGYQVLKQNQLVFKLIDLENVATSRVGYSPYTGIVSPAYIVLNPNKENESRYGEYFFLSMWQREVFNHMGDDGVRSSLNSSDLLNIPYLIIPDEEKNAIVGILDQICANINTVVEKTKATIEEYKKLKQSVITEAVTKGIRGDRAMKDSGIEWIGTIPSEWKVIPLQYFVDLNKETLGENTPEDYEFEYVEIGAVTLANGIEEYQHYKFSDAPSRARRVVHKGDIIVSTVRTYLKAIAIVPDKENVIVSTGFAVLTPKNICTSYLGWALKSEYFVHTVSSNSVGISYPAINASDLIKFKITVPDRCEQQEIADFLDRKCAEIDKLIADKTHLLEEMEIYKKSVIFEYVTGKKEIV